MSAFSSALLSWLAGRFRSRVELELEFNALPTNGRCEAIAAFEVRQGCYGNVTRDGVRFIRIYCWPASIPEGNGTRLTIIDDRASADQRAALLLVDGAKQGGGTRLSLRPAMLY